MYMQQRIFEFSKIMTSSYCGGMNSSRKKAAAENTAANGESELLLAEGHAVGALILSGVCLVGTNGDAVQGTVVFLLAVMGTLADGAFDGLVGMTAHKKASFEFGFGNSMRSRLETILGLSSKVAFYRMIWYADKKK